MVQLRPVAIWRAHPRGNTDMASVAHATRLRRLDSAAMREKPASPRQARLRSTVGTQNAASGPFALTAIATEPLSKFRDAQPRWPEAASARSGCGERSFGAALLSPPAVAVRLSREDRAKIFLEGHRMFRAVDAATQLPCHRDDGLQQEIAAVAAVATTGDRAAVAGWPGAASRTTRRPPAARCPRAAWQDPCAGRAASARLVSTSVLLSAHSTATEKSQRAAYGNTRSGLPPPARKMAEQELALRRRPESSPGLRADKELDERCLMAAESLLRMPGALIGQPEHTALYSL